MTGYFTSFRSPVPGLFTKVLYEETSAGLNFFWNLLLFSHEADTLIQNLNRLISQFLS